MNAQIFNAPSMAMQVMPQCALLYCAVTELPPDLKRVLHTQLTDFVEAIELGGLRGRFRVTRNSLVGIAVRSLSA